MKFHIGMGHAEQAIWDREGTGIGGNTCPKCGGARYGEAEGGCDSADHRKREAEA